MLWHLMTSWHLHIWKIKNWLSQERKELSKWNKKHFFLFHKCSLLDVLTTPTEPLRVYSPKKNFAPLTHRSNFSNPQGLPTSVGQSSLEGQICLRGVQYVKCQICLGNSGASKKLCSNPFIRWEGKTCEHVYD